MSASNLNRVNVVPNRFSRWKKATLKDYVSRNNINFARVNTRRPPTRKDYIVAIRKREEQFKKLYRQKLAYLKKLADDYNVAYEGTGRNGKALEKRFNHRD